MTASTRFPLGRVVATDNALKAVPAIQMLKALRRHSRCDWGELDPHDQAANTQALQTGGRLLSVYTTEQGIRFYVLTEADRSSTTVLLPEDY